MIDPKLLRGSLRLILDQLGIFQNLQRSPITQISNWSELFFFAARYFEVALINPM